MNTYRGNRIRRGFRRLLKLNPRYAQICVGPGTTQPYDKDIPGNIWVQEQYANGMGAPISVRGPSGNSVQIALGTWVELQPTADNRLKVVDYNVPANNSAGVNVLSANVPQIQSGGYVGQQSIITALLAPQETPDLTVTIKSWAIYIGGVYYEWPGTDEGGLDLSSYVPASGENLYAAVFINSDFASTTVATSTARLISDLPLDSADKQEALSAGPSDGTPIAILRLYGDQTEIVQADIAQDLRQMINTALGGGGSGTVTSVALTASPSGIFDVTGSPVTTAGTLALSMDNQTGNTVLASPSGGGSGQPAFRALVAADFPALPGLKVGVPWLLMCDAIATTNVTLATPGATFTGVTLTVSGTQRLFLQGQSSGAENGLWVWNGAASALTRPTDYPSGGTVYAYYNVIVAVKNSVTATGSGLTLWYLTTTGAVTIDTTATSWLFLTYNADAFTGILGIGHGGTGANLNATGPGFFKQATLGANATVAQLVIGDAPAGEMPAVYCSSFSNINISSPGSSFDGTTPSTGYVIGLFGQSTSSQNGPWTYNGSSSALTRPAWYPSGSTRHAFFGLVVRIVNGTTYGGSVVYCQTTAAITIDTTSTTWILPAVPVVNGGTGQQNQAQAFDALSPLTTKGDLIVRDASGNVRQAVGANNTVLVADSTQAKGIKWTATLVGLTLTTPTIASFANANHDHTNSAGGGQLNAGSVFSAGQVPLARGGTNVDLSASGSATAFLAQDASHVVSARSIVATDLPLYEMQSALINGGFALWSRQAITPTTLTSYADDAYSGADLWYVLTQTASVQNARVAGDTNSDFAARLKQNQASAQRMGYAQILEGLVAKTYRSKSVRFQARVNISNSQAVRVAIVEWTGTEDAPTSDIVNDWTSGTYTPGNFFISTTTTVTAVDAVTPGAGTYTDISVTGTVSASANNIIAFIWTEGTAAQNVTLDIAEAGFYEGGNAVPWQPPDPSVESLRAQRFLKVFNSPNTKAAVVLVGYSTGNTTAKHPYIPPVPFIATPTITVTAADWDSFSATATAASAITVATESTPTSIVLSVTAGSGGAAPTIKILQGDTSADRYLILSAEL